MHLLGNAMHFNRAAVYMETLPTKSKLSLSERH